MGISDWLDLRLQRRQEQILKEDILVHWSFLLDAGAKAVANDGEYSPRSGTTAVTLATEELRLRAVSMRDGFYVEVAPARAATEWTEMGLILAAIDMKEPVDGLAELPPSSAYTQALDAGLLLRRRLPDLQRGLSEEEYPATKRKILLIEELRRQEYEAISARNLARVTARA